MARPLRIQYANAWYHVMNRGRRGEKVFEYKDDYVCFIEVTIEANRNDYIKSTQSSQRARSKS